MKMIIALGVVMLILAVLANLAKGKTGKATKAYEYYRKKALTENEQTMYWRLIKALPNHVVLAQVGMSRCVGTKTKPAFATIAQKSIDFVICDKASDVIAAIEIDDKSHASKTRATADATKNNALKMAGIKTIRWPASALPSELEIQKAIMGATQRTTETH